MSSIVDGYGRQPRDAQSRCAQPQQRPQEERGVGEHKVEQVVIGNACDKRAGNRGGDPIADSLQQRIARQSSAAHQKPYHIGSHRGKKGGQADCAHLLSDEQVHT